MSFESICRHLSSSKFLPPALSQNRYLYRDRLIAELLHADESKKRLILIVAQAGQGKTTLAAQYLHLKNDAYAWCQVGREDRDPVGFFTAILLSLMKSFPAFRSPALAKALTTGEVSPLDMPRCVRTLLEDLKPHLPDRFWLVLDDIHFLADAPASRQLLDLLTEAPPPGLRFLFLSRRSVELSPFLPCHEILHLKNEELALTTNEIFELYNDVLSIPLNGNSARSLYQHTEGWIMGLLLSAHSVDERGNAALLSAPPGHAIEYFRKEILTIFPVNVRETLLKLALLEEIPSDLAESISPGVDIRSTLNDLAEKNFFILRLDESGSIFRFHHLFRDVLRHWAEKDLPPQTRSELYRGAAGYYLLRREVDKCLFYLLRLKDYQAVESLLEDNGLGFVAQNRVLTLGNMLEGMAGETVAGYPWIAYFLGVALLESEPSQALPRFEKAGRCFAARGDVRGDLLTLAQRIFFHVSIDCRFNHGMEALQRADALFPEARELLDDRSLLFVSMHLSLGFSLIRVEPEKARDYASVALSLARQGDLPSLEAFARFNIGIQNAFFGDHRQMLKEIERAYSLLTDPKVGTMSRMHLRILQLNALAITGDFVNFFPQERSFRQEIEGNIILETVAGPILLVNKIDSAVAEDRLDLAMERIEQGLSWGGPAESPHLRSQFLHYRAFVCALLGKTDEAEKAAAASHRMRQESGGEIWKIVSDMILGGALAHIGENEKAEQWLSRSITNSFRFGEKYLLSGALAHRAFLRLHEGRREEGLCDLRECLRTMRENGYAHFFTWTPREMSLLLTEAVRAGIEPVFARWLASTRLGISVLDDGMSLPLLEIDALGKLSLTLSNATPCIAARDLTPAQRELLGLLICTPAMELGQEEIQTTLWPESTPRKARSKFDNLLSRLRRVIDDRLGCDSARHYLVLEKGLLRLANYRIDSKEFINKAGLGLRHVNQGNLWQAENAFYSAHRLWEGDFLPGVRENDRLRDCRQDLQDLYFQSSLAWSEILANTGREDFATEVLEKAWRLDRSHEELAKALHRIYQRRKDFRKSRQVIKRYKEALLDLECSPQEILETLQGFSL